MSEEKEKLIELNEIFKELTQDALGLTEHLVYSIKQYIFSSVLMFLAAFIALCTFWFMYPYIITFFGYAFIIPIIFLTGSFIWLGLVAILNYRKLRKKYSKLFEIQKALEKEEK